MSVSHPAAGIALERHYRVKEVSAMWGYSRATILKAAAAEPGVLHMSFPGSKRKYDSISIPESVLLRIHDRLCQQPLESHLASGSPLRVIHLRDADATVPQQPRHVLKLHPREQLPHRKGIAQPVRPAIRDTAA